VDYEVVSDFGEVRAGLNYYHDLFVIQREDKLAERPFLPNHVRNVLEKVGYKEGTRIWRRERDAAGLDKDVSPNYI